MTCGTIKSIVIYTSYFSKKYFLCNEGITLLQICNKFNNGRLSFSILTGNNVSIQLIICKEIFPLIKKYTETKISKKSKKAYTQKLGESQRKPARLTIYLTFIKIWIKIPALLLSICAFGQVSNSQGLRKKYERHLTQCLEPYVFPSMHSLPSNIYSVQPRFAEFF